MIFSFASVVIKIVHCIVGSFYQSGCCMIIQHHKITVCFFKMGRLSHAKPQAFESNFRHEDLGSRKQPLSKDVRRTHSIFGSVDVNSFVFLPVQYPHEHVQIFLIIEQHGIFEVILLPFGYLTKLFLCFLVIELASYKFCHFYDLQNNTPANF